MWSKLCLFGLLACCFVCCFADDGRGQQQVNPPVAQVDNIPPVAQVYVSIESEKPATVVSGSTVIVGQVVPGVTTRPFYPVATTRPTGVPLVEQRSIGYPDTIETVHTITHVPVMVQYGITSGGCPGGVCPTGGNATGRRWGWRFVW